MSQDDIIADQWRPTGIWRFVPRGWLFHRYAVLQIEERRGVYRPLYTGFTPLNWQSQTRWRDATFLEALDHGTADEKWRAPWGIPTPNPDLEAVNGRMA